MPKVLIGFISYDDLVYLKASIVSLKNLSEKLKAKVVCFEAAGNEDVRKFLKSEFPGLKVIDHKDGNIGFGRGHNEILKNHQQFDYYLAWQPDIILNEVGVKRVLKEMEKDEEISMACGKVYFWDFEENEKTSVIDTFGIVAEKRHHFRDLGQGEEDFGQHDGDLDSIFGISGASYIFRASVIPKLFGSKWELFDSKMWMYKEDVDLAYRLRWLGEKVVIVNEVFAWHARTVSSGKKVPGYARRSSYVNHIRMMKNNFTREYGLGILLRVIFYEVLKAIYMLFLHPFIFLSGLRTFLYVKGRKSDRMVSSKQMLKYFL